MLSVPPVESMILLSACTDTLSACQEQHAEGNNNNKYAKGDKDDKPLDDGDNDNYAKGWRQTIKADAEVAQWEGQRRMNGSGYHDGRRRQDHN